MDEHEIFRQVGGRPMLPVGAKFADFAPADVPWNFGLLPQTPPVLDMIRATPSLAQRFPRLVGSWDGKTEINLLDSVRKIGVDPISLVQYQPRGTCGGRAGSLGLDLIQASVIASGRSDKKTKFRRASHAAVYYFARQKYGMDRGGNNENNDGVAGGAVPEILADPLFGVVFRDEIGDTNYYGEGSDDLACTIGGGQISADMKKKIHELGSDNTIVKVRCKSAQDVADVLFNRGVIVQSDSQGYTMQRDKDGFCRPSGTWAHYQVRGGIIIRNGRKGFVYYQSWNRDTPSGDVIPGYTGNCFGVDWDVEDKLCRTGEVDGLLDLALWDYDKGPIELNWLF
jgi:hypothetical protein